MEGGITDEARLSMLREAVARVGRDEMKAALAMTADPRFGVSKVAANALNALRKNRDPLSVVGRPQYRAALPYVAAALADECLSATIEALGDNSDDPTREQLDAALDEVGEKFPPVTVAVMLASVAAEDMPSSDLCFAVLDSDERFGLQHRADAVPDTPVADPTAGAPRVLTPEQREARREKKRRDAEERRKKQATARKAGEQVRQARRRERSERPGDGGPEHKAEAPVVRAAPRLTRRAVLTPAEESAFDRDDPWSTGVVFAWVSYDVHAADASDTEGKSRRCVVVAGSTTHLLVRPGYSEGGTKSRDWKTVPLRHWKRAGFDRPTWIDTVSLAIAREGVEAPVGWLTPEDWNALW